MISHFFTVIGQMFCAAVVVVAAAVVLHECTPAGGDSWALPEDADLQEAYDEQMIVNSLPPCGECRYSY